MPCFRHRSRDSVTVIPGAPHPTCRAGRVSVLIAPVHWANVLIVQPMEGVSSSVYSDTFEVGGERPVGTLG